MTPDQLPPEEAGPGAMGRLGGGVLILKKSERDLRAHMCGDGSRLESLHLLNLLVFMQNH